MSNLSKAQRDKLPASDFGWAAKRLYPVVDQDDLDSAASLLGKAPADQQAAIKATLKRIAARKGLKVPDAWKDDAEHSADFALGDGAEDGEYVLRSGKLFEAGFYPDKAFAITPEEMQAAVTAFQPVPLDLEHRATVLDGKLGELRSVELAEDGWTLTGTVALPKWLDTAIGDTERKVSATWDRATKTLSGLALVLNPRVADAALFSAYADFAKRHDTYRGQAAMQELHDTATRHGAVCKRPKAEMGSAHEAAAIQQAHDIAVEHGAQCDAKGARPYPTFSAPGGSTATNPTAPEEKKMGKLEKLAAWFAAAPDLDDEDEQPKEKPAAAVAATAAMSGTTALEAELKAERERRTQAEAEMTRLRTERIQSEAVRFAEDAISQGRAFPAEREALIAQHMQASLDDQNPAFGTVTFDGGKTTTSRVKLLESQIAARPKNQMDVDRLDPQIKAIFSIGNQATRPTEGTAEMSEERRRELLSKTDLGKQVLAEERSNGAARRN